MSFAEKEQKAEGKGISHAGVLKKNVSSKGAAKGCKGAAGTARRLAWLELREQEESNNEVKNTEQGDFPSSPGVRTLPSNAGGVCSIPDGGTKIPHASLPEKENTKQKQVKV